MKHYLPASYASASLELLKKGYTPSDVHAALQRSLKSSGIESELDNIVTALEEMVSFGEGEHVTVTSAHALTQDQKEEIHVALKGIGKEVSIAWKVDSKLIGGLTIQHGDDVMTYNVISILTQLRSHLET